MFFQRLVLLSTLVVVLTTLPVAPRLAAASDASGARTPIRVSKSERTSPTRQRGFLVFRLRTWMLAAATLAVLSPTFNIAPANKDGSTCVAEWVREKGERKTHVRGTVFLSSPFLKGLTVYETEVRNIKSRHPGDTSSFTWVRQSALENGSCPGFDNTVANRVAKGAPKVLEWIRRQTDTASGLLDRLKQKL